MIALVSYIREFLDDLDGDRWSDSRILYLINRSQQDIAKRTRILRKIYQFGTRLEQSKYRLPSDHIETTLVMLNGCELPFRTHDETMACGCTTCGVGRPRYTMLDKHERDTLIICPAPATSNSVEYRATTIYGIHTTDATTTYGVTLNAQVPVINTELLGILREIVDDDMLLKIHYIAKPKNLDSIHDTLEIDEEDAIKYYVCGHLLRADKDSNSRSLGKEELMLYEQKIAELATESSKDFTDGSGYSISYRRI